MIWGFILLILTILWIRYDPHIDTIETYNGAIVYLWYNKYYKGEINRTFKKLFEL